MLKPLIALAAASLLTPVAALADDFPERPIEIIVTYEPGSSADVMGRLLARHMSEHLPNNPQVVVVNRPGGGGTIGLTALTQADPDGYTIAYTTSSPVTIQPLYGRTSFTIDDLAPILKITEVPAALNVRNDSEFQTFAQWLDWVRAHPGEFTYATTAGTGSGTHLVTEALAAALGVQLRHVPFEGDSNAAAALTGGQLMGTMQMPTLHRGGDVRPLLFLTRFKPTRAVYDDIPTSADLGIPVVADFFAGFFAPAGTPPERVAVIEAAIRESMADQELVDFMNNAGLPPALAGHEEFAQIVAETTASNHEQLLHLGLIQQ
ncbi:MAG: tripartite tricarboxylate transporter substrate binding protein [Rhodobacteraceae bacterium]|nr:tripartite tricarboxylate transporter substrate binding protein [Paracoccaceae bacterium]